MSEETATACFLHVYNEVLDTTDVFMNQDFSPPTLGQGSYVVLEGHDGVEVAARVSAVQWEQGPDIMITTLRFDLAATVMRNCLTEDLTDREVRIALTGGFASVLIDSGWDVLTEEEMAMFTGARASLAPPDTTDKKDIN